MKATFQPTKSEASRRSDGSAYSRIDVAATLGVVAVLALLQVAASGHGRSKTKTLACEANLQRLSLAWVLYANDHQGRLAKNLHGGLAMNPAPGNSGWASGWLDWTTRLDNTNTLYLADPRYALLAPYLDYDSTPFSCPEDRFLSWAQRRFGWKKRVRSVAMNVYVGEGNAASGPVEATFLPVTNVNGFINPGPDSTFVFLEQHPDTINDPAFFAPQATSWIDLPASYHDGAAHVSFADGHAELHRWQTNATVLPVRVTTLGWLPRVPGDPDVAWVRDRTPRSPQP